MNRFAGKKIEFATQTNINRNKTLAQEFVYRIFDIQGAWISDESILWDFDPEATEEDIHLKIKNAYGIDVSDITSGNIVEIIERIASTR
jgi:hypothetical protein